MQSGAQTCHIQLEKTDADVPPSLRRGDRMSIENPQAGMMDSKKEKWLETKERTDESK